MIFNTYDFLFAFLPITFTSFFLVSKTKWAKAPVTVLIIASLVFYAIWNPPYVLLLAGSIVTNYAIGNRIINASRKRTWLVSGLLFNLGLIAYFKYTNFLVAIGFDLMGLTAPKWSIVLPLGISFFTFQQIAYLMDCHANLVKKGNFLHYAAFVSFFPQLIAGPIVHHKTISSQLALPTQRHLNTVNIQRGLTLLTIGLFKKVVLADHLSPFSATLFDSLANPSMADAWAGTIAFGLQIYFDFSGYSDMAIGLGRLFNLELPQNFNAPYKAHSMVDFWRRWHITLSTFLRDYLYIPLGGNRRGAKRRYFNLMVTMLLGGLWHGAAWTYVIWGGLHGVLLALNHAIKRLLAHLRITVPAFVGMAVTFILVQIAWVFFRAPDIDRATEIVTAMFTPGRLTLSVQTPFKYIIPGLEWVPPGDQRLYLLPALLIGCWLFPTSEQLEKQLQTRPIRSAFLVATLFVLALLSMSQVSEFLYYQF